MEWEWERNAWAWPRPVDIAQSEYISKSNALNFISSTVQLHTRIVESLQFPMQWVTVKVPVFSGSLDWTIRSRPLSIYRVPKPNQRSRRHSSAVFQSYFHHASMDLSPAPPRGPTTASAMGSSGDGEWIHTCAHSQTHRESIWRDAVSKGYSVYLLHLY